jgi:2-oxoglutarate dehydrogenase E1 component
MSRQDANAAFARTSFLYGGNADYLEQLYARYEQDPNDVDAEWRAFFASLKDNTADVRKSARGPSWELPDWPAPARGELVSALDGDWAEVAKTVGDRVKARAQTKGVELTPADVQQATRDSVRP